MTASTTQRHAPMPRPEARGRTRWFAAGLVVLVVASFWSLGLQWAQFLSLDAMRSMTHFVAEFFPIETRAAFVRQVIAATWQTLAMSALGTATAPPAGLALALPASRRRADAVVRYLVEHDVPLRKIHDVGVGAEKSEVAKTRSARKEERRVDVKVFTLDGTSTSAQMQPRTDTPTQNQK